MLYSIFTSPYYTDINSLLNLITEKDDLLLLQNGVFLGHKIICSRSGLYKNNLYLKKIKQKRVKVFALKDDIIARGLNNHISSYIFQISYIDFVKLTVKHSQYFAWLK